MHFPSVPPPPPLAGVSFLSHLTPNFITLAARVGYTDKEIRRGFSTRKAQITRITHTHTYVRFTHVNKLQLFISNKTVQKC
jgi:hypothetical protein